VEAGEPDQRRVCAVETCHSAINVGRPDRACRIESGRSARGAWKLAAGRIGTTVAAAAA
jgi:hypothetical protein